VKNRVKYSYHSIFVGANNTKDRKQIQKVTFFLNGRIDSAPRTNPKRCNAVDTKYEPRKLY